MNRFSPVAESWPPRLVWAVLLLLFAGAGRASAQLTWGTGGAGGAGTWNSKATNLDWWNGTANVAWSDGDDAVFAGTGGTVTVGSPVPTVDSLTFNAAGYVIQSASMDAGSNGLTITTNDDATISSTFDTSLGGESLLVKDGTGTLTISGTNFLNSLQVNAGQYLVSGSSTLTFSDVTLANAAGATVTLGQTSNGVNMGSLSGGGTTGGIVQPDTTARTVQLTVNGAGNFGGVLQNNGSGTLAFFVAAGNGATQVLSNANTYSGATTVQSGTLSLSGNGSILNSAVSVYSQGTLVLDNSAVANADRISSSPVFTLNAGAMQLIGNSSTALEQVLGSLKNVGASSITVTQPGSASTELTFSGYTRTAHATLNIIGSGVLLPGVANDSTGIVTPTITAGNDWASVGGDGRITAFSNYVTSLNAATASSNVLLTSGGTATLSAASTYNSLNLQNSNGVNQVLDLGGQGLGLASGGLLTSGSSPSLIQDGNLSTSAAEWVITTNNSLTISAPILEAGTATNLTKTGTGTLTLSGTNTYAGTTSINEGTLAVASDSNLGNGATIEFGGGTLQAAASFSSTKGFTNPTVEVGYINTNGFNLSFSGVNSGAIDKLGTGTLTLSNASTGTTHASVGTLALPNATSGNAYLQGGTVQAAGTLSSLTLSTNSTLEIGGGLAAATLVTNSLNVEGATQLTIDFGLGSAGQDLWSIGGTIEPLSLSTGLFQFDFQNLGGVTTGVPYELMSFDSVGGAPATTLFGIADSAAGWAGTFSTTTTSASITFTATPEPDLTVLLAVGSGFVLSRRLRRRS